MFTVTLDVIQTVALGAIVYVIGGNIKNRVPLFQKYFIPAPVIGGLLCSFLVFALLKANLVEIKMTNTLQNFFMNIFFTCTGFTVSIPVIKKSGKQGAILAVIAVFFLVIQNLVGISLAQLLGINKLLGVAMSSISMSGGVGSGAAFGPTLEMLGADGGTTVGVAAATFGLLAGSLVGGPVAKRLIDKHHLKADTNTKMVTKEKSHIPLIEKNLLNTVLYVLLAAGVGSVISWGLNSTGLTFPYYVGCLFAGTIFRNIAEACHKEFRMEEVDIFGNISLNLFLSMTLMSLNIAKLVGLALPMLVILLAQTIVMAIYASTVTFKSMGGNYDAAVMAAGHCGVGLGQTPNAIANMSSVIEENGPAPNAWFVLPVITVVFINIFNPIVITAFINLVK
ncbi:sodium/glutamate symporter [Clostridium sp. E02]|uniref:sodium/glutamate symporter n=1 Tax=Clostridium sp. E02 TaxID=2487134 RepID=UPI000F5277D5|nr:sodium/glutamate symporter [Clostridium sp. E02]